MAAVTLLVAAGGCGGGATDDAGHEPTPPLGTAEPQPSDSSRREVMTPWTAESLPPDSSRREVTTPASCSGLPGADEELALTPRMDVESEGLALLLAGTFTADSATYERIRRDLASIRSRVPELQDVRRRYLNDIIIGVDATTLDAIEAGTYTAWDCLHARYGWVDKHYLPLSSLVVGALVARVDKAVVARLYEQLPGVTHAYPSSLSDGPTVCADRDPDGLYHYVFDRAGGDCPSGCIEHHWYYFVSEQDGRITPIGEHEYAYDTPLPEWVRRYGRSPDHSTESHCL